MPSYLSALSLSSAAWPRARLASVAGSGALAGLLSTAVMVWRGRRDTGSAAAPVNAVSHWLWPVQALQRDGVTMKYTATGTLVHAAAGMLWAWLFDELRSRRRHPSAANALVDAAAVTALASWVDLKLVPERLSPGFERRLRPSSTAMVYVGFAAGLALAGLMANRGAPDRR